MPSNPQRDVMRCFAEVRRVLERLPVAGVVQEDLVLDSITRHPVTARSVEHFIQRFFVGRGVVRRVDGMLFPVPKAERVSDGVVLSVVEQEFFDGLEVKE